MKNQESSWKDWRYFVRINVPVVNINGKEKQDKNISAEINLIQAVVIKKDIEKVKCITNLALEEGQDYLDDLLKYEMKCLFKHHEWKLSPECSWILNANAIHLATCGHVESLAHSSGMYQ